MLIKSTSVSYRELCSTCHQLGHFRYECLQWEKEVNYAKLEEEEEMLLMLYVKLNQSRMEDVWFLDSGCNNHMCATNNGSQILMRNSDNL